MKPTSILLLGTNRQHGNLMEQVETIGTTINKLLTQKMLCEQVWEEAFAMETQTGNGDKLSPRKIMMEGDLPTEEWIGYRTLEIKGAMRTMRKGTVEQKCLCPIRSSTMEQRCLRQRQTKRNNCETRTDHQRHHDGTRLVSSQDV